MKYLRLLLFVLPLWGQSNIRIDGHYDTVIDNNVLNVTIKSENIHPVDGEDEYGILLIRSDGGKLSLNIKWGGMYLGLGSRDVTYRIGAHPAVTENWETTNKYTVTIAKRPVELIKLINENKTVTFRTTPYQESPITYEFDLSGLQNVVDKYPNHFRSVRPKPMIEIVGNLATLSLLAYTIIYVIF